MTWRQCVQEESQPLWHLNGQCDLPKTIVQTPPYPLFSPSHPSPPCLDPILARFCLRACSCHVTTLIIMVQAWKFWWSHSLKDTWMQKYTLVFLIIDLFFKLNLSFSYFPSLLSVSKSYFWERRVQVKYRLEGMLWSEAICQESRTGRRHRASHGQGCYRSKGLEATSDHVIVILSKANPDRDVKDARHHQPHIIPRQRSLAAKCPLKR